MATSAYERVEKHEGIASEAQLVRVAVQLNAHRLGGPLSTAELALIRKASAPLPRTVIEEMRASIKKGRDPLGAALYSLRPGPIRRTLGAVYTPAVLIRPMVKWVLEQKPETVIDAGTGSGRFSLEVARRSPGTSIIAVDSDPLATLMTRAMLAAIGHRRATVLNQDFTRVALAPTSGRTAFIGNPPYVRHHQLSPTLKAWAQTTGRKLNLTVSGLAGLHAYFFLATAVLGRPDDVGCFVTSAEWLDVNYGAIIRQLLLDGLGGQSIHVLDSTIEAFDDTATTAAITCFRVGTRARSIRLRTVKAVEDIGTLSEGKPVARERLQEARRWTPLVRTRRDIPSGYIELGELCRVHRGQVTGRNAVWITTGNEHGLPEHVLYATITKARELFKAGAVLESLIGLRRVIDLPEDLDELDDEDRRIVDRFLRKAKEQGANIGYVAESRRAWWAVGLRKAAPILATYMARRPPAFVRNLAGARHVNIAHGLYPRIELPAQALDRLADELRGSITVAQGRTYAGGLTKFEPKEMERLPVPDLPQLIAAP